MDGFLDFLSQMFRADVAGGNIFGAVLGALLRSLGGALAGAYAVVGSYALAIAAITIFVRLLMWPVITKQTKSMHDMQRLQPEVAKIRAKYKSDRERMSQEMMALYHEHGVNPAGGCLPMLVQAVVSFLLWRVVAAAYGSTYMKPFAGSVTDFCSNELGQPSQCVTGTAFLPPGSSLFKAIQAHDVGFLGIDLTRPASAQHGVAAVLGIVLVLAVMGTSWYSQKQLQRRTGNVNPQMQMMTRVMPVVLGVFTYQFAAGLAIFWLVGNVWQILQQRLVLQHEESAEHEHAGKQRAGSEKDAKGGVAAKAKGGTAGRAGHGQKQRDKKPGGDKGGLPKGGPKKSDGDKARASGGSAAPKAGVAAHSRGASQHRSKKKRKKKGR